MAARGTVPAVGASLVGSTVDTRYELRRLVARGGMGLVFEAHHRFTRRAVALKILPQELRGKKEARSRLLREAHALTTVRHPRAWSKSSTQGGHETFGPYVVVGMLDGRTLDGILAARRRLAVLDALVVGRQVCEAVAHAHARGVVHRDLKPSNFFVARNEIGDERVKVIDLGVASLNEMHLAQHDSKITLAQEVLGTPEYMAPEQLWGRPVDARADVYSIGMSLYECLTGEIPYTGSYPDVLVQVTSATEPPRVREMRPDAPKGVAEVVERALAKEASRRYANAAELGQALAASGTLIPERSTLLAPLARRVRRGRGGLRARTPDQLVPEEARPSTPRRSQVPPRAGGVTVRARALRHSGPHRVLVGPRGAGYGARRSARRGCSLISPVPFELGVRVAVQFATPVTRRDDLLPAATVRWMRDAGRRRAARWAAEFGSVPTTVRGIVSQYISMFPAAH